MREASPHSLPSRAMPEILPYLASALLYGAVAFYFWRVRGDPAGVTGNTPAATRPAFNTTAIEHYLVLVPLALHTVVLARAAFAPDGLHLGVGIAVSAILWLTVLIYWLGNFFYRLDGLQSMVLPLAAAAVWLPALMPAARALPNTELAAFKIHLLIALLAYSLFTIASLHVALMALLERRLHDGTVTLLLQRLPPLLTMEA